MMVVSERETGSVGEDRERAEAGVPREKRKAEEKQWQQEPLAVSSSPSSAALLQYPS